MAGTMTAIAQAASRNAPKIFFALGVASVTGSVIATARVAPEAEIRMMSISDDAFEDCCTYEEHRKYKIQRALLEVVPLYIPTALLLGGGIAMFAASNRILSTRAASAAAMYALAERTIEGLDAYRDEVIERYGDEVDRDIRQKVADDVPKSIVERSKEYFADYEVANRFPHNNHDTLWYDRVTQRWFWATKEAILNAESTINQQLLDCGIATVNDFYAALFLDCEGQLGNAAGWRSDHPRINKMDILFGSKTDEVNFGLAVDTITYRTTFVDPRALEER